jgi:hypothetical protein
VVVSFHLLLGRSGKGEGSYPAGGVGYPRLARLRLLAARVLHEFARSPGQDILGAFVVKFFAKNGTIFTGKYPHSSPSGGLGFQGKAESLLTLFKMKLHLYNRVGRRICAKNLEILSKGRSDVVVGCSKRW